MLSLSKLEVFREITIGGLTKEQLLRKLSDAGIQFNKYAIDLFDHPQFAPSAKTEKVKLVKITLSGLGLNETCSFEEFLNRASQLELKLCPLYLGAFLRIEYLDQPEGAYLTIASNKPEPNESYPNGFYIRNFENILWLRGYKADDYSGWPEQNEFIFIR